MAQMLKANALHRKSAFGGRFLGIFWYIWAQFSAMIRQKQSKLSAIWQNQIFALTLAGH